MNLIKSKIARESIGLLCWNASLDYPNGRFVLRGSEGQRGRMSWKGTQTRDVQFFRLL